MAVFVRPRIETQGKALDSVGVFSSRPSFSFIPREGIFKNRVEIHCFGEIESDYTVMRP